MTRTTTDPVEEGGGYRAAALGVLVASVALAAAGLVITAVVRPEWNVGQWYFAVDTVDAVVYGIVAWLLLARTRHPVAWLLALTAVGGGLAAVGAQWTTLWVEHPDLPELENLQLMQNTGWVPGTYALIVIVPWLLRAGPLDRLAKVGITLGALLITWTLVTRLTDPWAMPGDDPGTPFAIRSESWESFVERSNTWQNTVLVALGVVAGLDVLRRRARTEDEGDRRALIWLAASVLVLALSFVPLSLPDRLAAELPLAFTPVVHLLSQALYPAAVLGVVLRQRLWGIDLAVRRTLAWWLLTSALLAGYIGVVAILGELAPGNSTFAPVVATAIVAAAVQPAHSAIQRAVDALVHGDARNPARVVQQLGRSLGTATKSDELLTGMLEGLASSLRLGGARIRTTTDGLVGVLDIAAEVGTVDERAATLPLVHRQTELGTLEVAPRPNERLDGRSLEVVEGLAPVIAATVALATTTEELRASRARLAEARDEERRVLRRELHDGLGPALAGIGLGFQAGRNLLRHDPEAAAALVDRLAAELDARVSEVRDLARGLLPPALEELGLAPALEELAERHATTGLVVDVATEGLGAVAPEVGSAVYAIVAEAVRNVHRHAQASRCTITVRTADDELVATVVDDGVGVPPDAVPGVGTRSMRERAEGLGGTTQITPATPTGTAVVVRVPLHAGRPVAP